MHGWLYDNATGLLTNKVYADDSRVSRTYTPSGKPDGKDPVYLHGF